ncbi:CGP-CTERM-anchored Cys-rich protein [Thermococcus waiotapuensis]|uniref:CGP-CTERM-anchored Cys-rich protein n=1 Tax=Thermococcus waiotapuensis TaxID=90909 RepID=A0AAE4NUH6_9EURY|nr:CGP-CTERM-anchored Cys-rich protein [Thermococcus waiotapuensis]MDV3103840.1 CGP-CTERM-anchored Cys-rich protein [Thermococcus waiotapuensis]
MKKIVGVWILLMMLSLPLAVACYTPRDGYSVEVVLNKPGISYNPGASAPGTLTFGNRTFLLKVWNDSKGIHVRVEIPEKIEPTTYWSYSGALVLTTDNLRELTKLGWMIAKNGSNVNVFKKGNVTLTIIFPERECSSDSDCATGGCSGEICMPKDEAEKIASPCLYAEWYECLKLTSCGCVNGLCSWKLNPAFEACLREHSVDPNNVIKTGVATVVGATGTNPEELRGALKEFFSVVGINCTEFILNSDEVPVYNPEEVSAPEAMKAALEKLQEAGVISGLSEEDIKDILSVASWGKAGWNSHIGWYETKDGTYAWIPYYESKDPQLVKCSGGPETGNLNPGSLTPGSGDGVTQTNQAAEEKDTDTGGANTICGPASIVGLSLIWLITKKKR